MNVDQPFQDRDNVIPTRGPFHFNGKRFFAEHIGDVQVFQNPAITGLIELEVQRPQMIRARRAKPVRRVRAFPYPCTFTLLHPHPQPLIPVP